MSLVEQELEKLRSDYNFAVRAITKNAGRIHMLETLANDINAALAAARCTTSVNPVICPQSHREEGTMSAWISVHSKHRDVRAAIAALDLVVESECEGPEYMGSRRTIITLAGIEDIQIWMVGEPIVLAEAA